jgi:hypothetical protein
MGNPYDLHSWSKRYREAALREARTRDLVRLARSSGGTRRPGARATPIRTILLSLLGR